MTRTNTSDEEEPAAKPVRQSAPPDPAFRSWLVDPLKDHRSSRPAAPMASSADDAVLAAALRTGDLEALAAAVTAAPPPVEPEEADGRDPEDPDPPVAGPADATGSDAPDDAAGEPEDLALPGQGEPPRAPAARARWTPIAAALLLGLVGVSAWLAAGGAPPSVPGLAAPATPELTTMRLLPDEPPAEPQASSSATPAPRRAHGTGASPLSSGEPVAGPPRANGPSVGRLPDLPREQLRRLAREAEATKVDGEP